MNVPEKKGESKERHVYWVCLALEMSHISISLEGWKVDIYVSQTLDVGFKCGVFRPFCNLKSLSVLSAPKMKNLFSEMG